LLGAGTVINADVAIRALDGPWDLLYGVLVAAALTSAAAATYLAAQVAAGGLHEIPADVRERLSLRDRLFDHAVRKLRWSHWATALALFLLACSFAVRWYAPSTPTG